MFLFTDCIGLVPFYLYVRQAFCKLLFFKLFFLSIVLLVIFILFSLHVFVILYVWGM